jgi:two-component system, LytTR family, response regulator
MKKILIVDDELLSRAKIRRFIEVRPENFQIFEASNGLEALDIIESQEPDIVFLDIEMPEMNGMDLIQTLGQPKFALIFQTAYSEFAVEAFEKNALDYLLKPFNQERFDQAMEKALSTTTQHPPLQTLAQGLAHKKVYLSKVVVKRGTKNTLIPIEDVLWFKSENHYTYVCTKDFEYIYSEPLKDLNDKLDPKDFLQVHRNAIIRVNTIKDIIQGDNMRLVLENGAEVPVSRSNKKVIKDKILKQEVI